MDDLEKQEIWRAVKHLEGWRLDMCASAIVDAVANDLEINPTDVEHADLAKRTQLYRDGLACYRLYNPRSLL